MSDRQNLFIRTSAFEYYDVLAGAARPPPVLVLYHLHGKARLLGSLGQDCQLGSQRICSLYEIFVHGLVSEHSTTLMGGGCAINTLSLREPRIRHRQRHKSRIPLAVLGQKASRNGALQFVRHHASNSLGEWLVSQNVSREAFDIMAAKEFRFTSEQIFRTRRRLFAELGKREPTFSTSAFLAQVADAVATLRVAGKSNADIAKLIRKATGVPLTEADLIDLSEAG